MRIRWRRGMRITKDKASLIDGGFRPLDLCQDRDQRLRRRQLGRLHRGSPGPVAATVERYAEWVIGLDPMQAEAIWWDLSTASVRLETPNLWKARLRWVLTVLSDTTRIRPAP